MPKLKTKSKTCGPKFKFKPGDDPLSLCNVNRKASKVAEDLEYISQTSQLSQLHHLYSQTSQLRIYSQSSQIQPLYSQNTISSPIEDEDDKYLLPKPIVPIHYAICIKPNLTQLSFEGCVAIQSKMAEETVGITLHSSGLLIHKIVWEDDSTERRQEAFEFNLHPNEQLLNIVFQPPLAPGNGILFVNFRGKINDTIVSALYASTIIDKFGSYTNAITKFAPAESRKCFPCFDEPSIKATFGLSFVVPKSTTVISNMPIKITFPHRSDRTLHIVEFERTPKISTHLLAFAVGEFNFIENRISRDLVLRLYSRDKPPNIAAGNFALDICEKFISYYTSYFEVPFPLKKLDLVAAKNCTDEAIQNWGLLVFKEGKLLIDNKDAESKMAMLITLSHVVCQQWLGNLVTLKWWNSKWFFETLTTFMEFLSIDTLGYQDEIWTRFVQDVHMKALELDSILSSHVIQVTINSPNELNEAFDALTYNKGTALLRMLHAHVGPQVFQNGVHMLLRQFAYGNARTMDFWEILEYISGKKVRAMMATWTKKQGFPVIRVVSSQFEKKTRTITIQQDPFMASADQIVPKRKPPKPWIIPILISTESKPTKVVKEILMEKRLMTFTLKMAEKDWFKLNFGHSGFYRVKYQRDMMASFIQSVRSKNLPLIDRIGFLNDTYALAAKGIGTCGEIFTLLEAFVDEEDYYVWIEIDSIIGALEQLVSKTECADNFLNFAKFIYYRIYMVVGWNGNNDESHLYKKLRNIVITRMLVSNHEECIAEGRRRFDALWLGEPFSSEQRCLIYKAVMVGADTITFNMVIRRFKELDPADLHERGMIIQSLGLCKDPKILRSVIEFSVSAHVLPRDTITIMESMASHATGRTAAWDFFKNRFGFLFHRYTPVEGGQLVTRIVKTVTESFNTEEMEKEISEFFQFHNYFSLYEKTVALSLEKIHNLESWLNREKASIIDYLSIYLKESSLDVKMSRSMMHMQTY